MQVLSLTWGILSLVGVFVAFFPCLGALNWLTIPFAIVGLIISIATLATTRSPERGGATAGVICCAIAIAIGLVRLALGGGVL